MEKFTPEGIAGQIRTPAYVFSEQEFFARAEAVREAFGPETGLCYSIKANPFLLEILPDHFSKIEVCSPGELEICIDMNIDPEKIIYSGLHKEREDIARAIDYGAGTLTAESAHHVREICACAGERGGGPVDLLLRVSDSSQFGIDREELIGMIEGLKEDSRVRIAGLHYFSGTQKTRSKQILRELDFLETYMERIRRETGVEIKKLEYGTGLGVEYFADKKNEGDAEKAEAREMALLEEIAPRIRRMAEVVDLTVEMGRFFAASCGHYYTTVADTKRNDGVNYAVIDGGSHQIRYYGHMQGMQLPFITRVEGGAAGAADATAPVNAAAPAGGEPDAGKDAAVADRTWTICGSLCTTADVLARTAEFDALRPEDALIFHKTGAYSIYESMTMFLSRDMARIYIADGDGTLRLRRDRLETNPFTHA